MNTKLEKYLCGRAALEYWQVPNLKGGLEPSDVAIPEEHVIFTDQTVYRPQGIILHTCRIKGAEKYTQDGVCTLPLVFLQMANEYSIHKLIFLGLQICSYQQSQRPLCSKKELASCAKELCGHRGRRKALRALRYIEEGSRSPMESYLYMFLRLPNALGGCGITTLQFNTRITTKKTGKLYYADLYVPSHKLIIEYDSRDFHNNEKSFSRDKIRATSLSAEGYQVVSVCFEQLAKIHHFETLALDIASRVGKKIRIRARKFFEGFTALMDLLLQGAKACRTRAQKVLFHEVPKFSGVRKVYDIYEIAWNKLHNYPKRSLLLTRAP
ncbi:MAG: hypothetical protein GX939_08935 [Clostridiaceae bacterium]|jgi:very-short-patch-repair endonuclease|nr:hypothetical protein [Clostridiaceae bacterium]